MRDAAIAASEGAGVIHVIKPPSGEVLIKQESDIISASLAQAVQLHDLLGEYIEATKPKLPTAGESVVQARVPNGDTISLIFNSVSRSWWANTGADYDSSELRDWTLIHDAGRPL